MPVSCSGGGNTVTITFSLRPVSSSQGKEDVNLSCHAQESTDWSRDPQGMV